jgi:cobalamin-dependent methionine synthase I
MLREQLAAAKAEGVLVPQVVYGYFPANGDGDDLVVWTDESPHAELAGSRSPPARRSRSCASPTSSGPSSRARSTTPRSTS